MATKIQREIDADKGVARLEFPDGRRAEIWLNGLQEHIMREAALQGLVQQITRQKDPQAALQQLQRGEWPGRKRGGAGGKAPLAVQALAHLTGKPLETVFQRWREEWTKETKQAIQRDVRVKRLMEELRAKQQTEQAETKVDVQALFNEGTGDAGNESAAS